jgi:hypothetical protein
MKYHTIDIYDKDGNMVRIEAYDSKGDFIMQALWDPTDEQTSENRIKLREWFNKHLERSQK